MAMANTSSATTIVPQLLERGNYKSWSIFMEDYLISQELWDGIIIPFVFSANHPLLNESEWRKRNAAVLNAIKISCGPESFVHVKYTRSAKDALDMLAEMHTEPETDESTPKMNVAIASTIVPELLERGNYERWSIFMKNYLVSQDLWVVIQDDAKTLGVSGREWRKKNASALHAIQITCGAAKFDEIKYVKSAKNAWDTFEKKYKEECSSEDDYDIADSGSQTMERAQSLILYNAINKGDVDAVMKFFQKNPEVKKFGTWTGDTALHYATMVGKLDIVKALVESMSAERQYVQQKDQFIGTALNYAAVFGYTEIAEYLVGKDLVGEDSTLLSTEDIRSEEIPVVAATRLGYKELTSFLYSKTPFHILLPENGSQGSKLLFQCFQAKRFDIIYDALHRCPGLIDENWKHLLDGFARTPAAFVSGSRLTFWQRWIYESLKVENPSEFCAITINQQGKKFKRKLLPGIKQIHALKLRHVFARASLRLISHRLSELKKMKFEDLEAVDKALTKAIENGIYDFLIEMTETNADILIAPLGAGVIDRKNFLTDAIAFRQEKIARFIIGLPLGKLFLLLLDAEDNNVLHIAGQLASNLQLSRISGPALSMQREIQWFKGVESLVGQYHKDAKNVKGETAYQVFATEHKDLLTEAENWTKGLANSYIIAGALIITIMFAAAFTLPGGNNQTEGFPIFKNKAAFMIYIISDAISLFVAAASVLIFLGFLTSRYNMEDFHKSIPRKLMAGLSALFISLAAMMLAFCSAIFLMLENRWWVIIPSVLFAGIPISLFVWLQFPLLVEIYVSTYKSPIFSKKRSLASKIKAFFLGEKED